MLWGKKSLESTEHPREALDVMIELNNRYALDGRDPNSYSGIFWVMGRFDRGWPERPVFGKVRSMTSRSTRRKVSLDGYLKRWGDSAHGGTT
jgi:deoxyribodipyrimidine photo-lyase